MLAKKSFPNSIVEMTKKSNVLYNSQLDIQESWQFAKLCPFINKYQDLRKGGKVHVHRPRHFVNSGSLFRSDYIMPKSKIYQVNKSEVDNYKILCKLACFEYQRLVLSTFWLLVFTISCPQWPLLFSAFHDVAKMLCHCLESGVL